MKVFLSYALHDKEEARDLAKRLSNEGLDVWFDEWQLQPGDNWSKQVGRALDQADAMVVLVTPEAMKSKGVRGEIEYALMTPRFEGTLVPVVLKPSEDMPWILDRMAIRADRNRAATVRKILKSLHAKAVN
jgi:hypothetical protein